MLGRYKTEVVAVGIVLALFLITSHFSQTYFAALTELLEGHETTGMLIYVVGATVTTVIAPLSFLPILPVAVSLWGSFAAAVLSIVAWTLGAAVAFLLARRFGRPLVRRLIGERKMSYLSALLPARHMFIAVVFMRIALPVDLLSYALGLFGAMPFVPYILATLIGITPFALVFSYLADLHVQFQIGAFIIGAVFIALGFPYMRKRYRSMFMGKDDFSERREL